MILACITLLSIYCNNFAADNNGIEEGFEIITLATEDALLQEIMTEIAIKIADKINSQKIRDFINLNTENFQNPDVRKKLYALILEEIGKLKQYMQVEQAKQDVYLQEIQSIIKQYQERPKG